jgi:hypothetical protein
MATMPQTRYLNIYYVGPFGIKPASSTSSSEGFYNFDVCNFKLCGGQANYETTTAQSVSLSDQSWNLDVSYIIPSGSYWSSRGALYGNGSAAGLFSLSSKDGSNNNDFTFRVLQQAF